MDHLEKEIQALFGEDQKTADGQEKAITFSQYLDQINQRSVIKRKKATRK
jgi:hypothetical protein